jgi:Asp-tRNA(Asn)/Glu-tRNA(Gln) amidotransferase A subunit family amidase
MSGVQVTELELPSEFEESHEVHATIYDKSLSYYFAEENLQSGRVSPIMNRMIEKGKEISVEAYNEALRKQARLICIMDDIMSQYDACICLSTAGEAPKRNVMENRDQSLMWTLTHLPALNVPVFISPDKLPFGLQVVARKYNDYLMLDFVEFLKSIDMIPKQPFPEITL